MLMWQFLHIEDGQNTASVDGDGSFAGSVVEHPGVTSTTSAITIAWIARINHGSSLPALAVSLPSGVSVSRGEVVLGCVGFRMWKEFLSIGSWNSNSRACNVMTGRG